MKNTITEDDTWIYAYGGAKGKPRLEQSHQSHSKTKLMLTDFFNCSGVMHYVFFPPSQAVSKIYNLKFMEAMKAMAVIWTNK